MSGYCGFHHPCPKKRVDFGRTELAIRSTDVTVDSRLGFPCSNTQIDDGWSKGHRLGSVPTFIQCRHSFRERDPRVSAGQRCPRGGSTQTAVVASDLVVGCIHLLYGTDNVFYGSPGNLIRTTDRNRRRAGEVADCAGQGATWPRESGVSLLGTLGQTLPDQSQLLTGYYSRSSNGSIALALYSYIFDLLLGVYSCCCWISSIVPFTKGSISSTILGGTSCP